jgi:hypothetical protein
MAWTARYLNTTFPSCPLCASSLLELSDMWGVFYACDECGYETETIDPSPENHHFEHGHLVRPVPVAAVGPPGTRLLEGWLSLQPGRAGSSELLAIPAYLHEVTVAT